MSKKLINRTQSQNGDNSISETTTLNVSPNKDNPLLNDSTINYRKQIINIRNPRQMTDLNLLFSKPANGEWSNKQGLSQLAIIEMINNLRLKFNHEQVN